MMISLDGKIMGDYMNTSEGEAATDDNFTFYEKQEFAEIEKNSFVE